jgi:hypothetical protein
MNTSSCHLTPSNGTSLTADHAGSDRPELIQQLEPSPVARSRGARRRRQLIPAARGWVVGLLCGLGLPVMALSACNNSGGLLDEPGAALLPGVKINLPPPPSFAEPNIPKEYPDGSVSIYGLRKEFHRYSDQKNKYLDQKVKVKAYLLDIYKCPECPKKQTCKPCDAPHMFAVDEPGAPKEKGLLIAEYRGPKGKEPKLTLGKQYTFEGTFNLSSPAGFSASDGLLYFNKMVDDTNKDFIGPAEELERTAATQQAAYEKAMKAKGAAAPQK